MMRKMLGVFLLGIMMTIGTGCSDGGHSSGSAADTTVPTAPTNLTATAESINQINLSWDAATDNVGVGGYKIYRDGVLLKSVTGTSASDKGLSADTQYCYSVSAYDAFSNESPLSEPSCTRTLKMWSGTKMLGTTFWDGGNGITEDQSGNVYVTGGTQGNLDENNAGGSDIFLAKYDVEGTRQWTRQLGSVLADEGEDVAVDNSGNIYVTGETWGALDGNTHLGYADIFLVKYNAAGTKLWTRQFGTSLAETSYGVAVDNSGNIYITGETKGDMNGNINKGSSDIILVKYDAAGTRQWTKQLGTAAADEGRSVAVDSGGNIYVTGYTWGDLDGDGNSGLADVFLVKYDTEGARQWIHQMGSSLSDIGYGMALDIPGNIYITGETYGDLHGTNAGDSDIFLAKYDAGGMRQWTRQLGSSSSETGYGVALDTVGNIYVTGKTWGDLNANINAGGSDIFLVKYNMAGTRQWTRQPGTALADEGKDVAVDSKGNIYVTGYTWGDLDGAGNAGLADAFLLKYDTEGVKQ